MHSTEIFTAISNCLFSLENEKQLQAEIAQRLEKYNIPYMREHHLDARNIIDFYSFGTGIEIKISGSAKEIYRQCERYCQFEQVKSLILVTNRSMGFPEAINGKRCYILNLGKAWL